MTFVEVVFLLFGGMSLFESLVHSFGTAGTGGFSVKANGIAALTIYELLPAFIISCIFIVVVSLLTKEPSDEIKADFDAVKSGETEPVMNEQ